MFYPWRLRGVEILRGSKFVWKSQEFLHALKRYLSKSCTVTFWAILKVNEREVVTYKPLPIDWLLLCVLILPTPLGQIIHTLSNSSNIVARHYAWGREMGWDNPFEHYFKLSTLCIHSFHAYAWQWAIAIFQLLPTFFNQCHHLSNFATLYLILLH